jgi:hypothetical protein
MDLNFLLQDMYRQNYQPQLQQQPELLQQP